MSETLRPRSRGLTANALHTWGMLFVVAGIVGSSLLQNAMLGITDLTNSQILELLNTKPDAMGLLTVSLVLEFLYACAAPIFAFLLVEGFTHTSNFKNYIFRVAGVAVLAEIPYNLAMGGALLVTDSRNPAFALVICLVMLYLYNRYPDKMLNSIAVKAFVTLAAFLWVGMLRIEEGSSLLLLTVVLWSIRNKPNFRSIVGCAAAFGCTIFSLYYAAAPLVFLAIHAYNGEKGENNKLANYLSYPVLLLAFGLLAEYVL